MPLPPPLSTLFPYTTLFRSICSFECTFCHGCTMWLGFVCPNCGGELTRRPRPITVPATDDMKRSEEHTSELQSHSDIVCRLLLEKKTKVRRHVDQPSSSGSL